MTILSKLYSVAFKNYSYKAKNWRTVLPCNAKKKSDTKIAVCVLYKLVSLCWWWRGYPPYRVGFVSSFTRLCFFWYRLPIRGCNQNLYSSLEYNCISMTLSYRVYQTLSQVNCKARSRFHLVSKSSPICIWRANTFQAASRESWEASVNARIQDSLNGIWMYGYKIKYAICQETVIYFYAWKHP